MKQFSAKRSIQILGHVLEQYGIDKMVISPGSRNAPLAIHFSELDSFECFSIVAVSYTHLDVYKRQQSLIK